MQREPHARQYPTKIVERINMIIKLFKKFFPLFFLVKF